MALGHSSLSETPLGALPSAATGAYTLDAGADSYAITGAAVAFLRSLSPASEPGAYALTGADATFLRTVIASTDSVSYGITGADAELTYVSQGGTTYAGAFGGMPIANPTPAPWQKNKNWIAAVLVGSGIVR